MDAGALSDQAPPGQAQPDHARPDHARPLAVDVGTGYLLTRFAALQDRVRDAVRRRQAVDPEPDDRFRGLYISDGQALHLLDDREPLSEPVALLEDTVGGVAGADRDGALDGAAVPLRDLARAFGLTPIDIEILLIAMGPDIDPRLERAYGYLHDDVTRRRASVGLAIELCGRQLFESSTRGRLTPNGPLIANQLVLVEEPERPFLSRSLRVPDGVTEFLLGDRSTDAEILPYLARAVTDDTFDTGQIVRGVQGGLRLVYIRDRIGAAALSFAATAAAALGRGELTLDLTRLGADDDVAALARAVTRQARMTGAILVAGPIEVLAERGPATVRLFAETDATAMLIGSPSWDPAWSRQPPLVVAAPDIPRPFSATLPFRLTPEQSLLAHEAASGRALAEGVDVTNEQLAAGARAQNAGGLERLSLRIESDCGWADLVVPLDVRRQLNDLVDRIRHRGRVFDDWRLRRGAAKGQGVTGLFSGESGTGKTLAAEVVARELGLDLYVIDLATVVDKYIGETEKNLDRIFGEADRVNGVLLFDEADAIFGKRSEVQDARDRYANVEVAYLLQRMERFDGVAILTTNLRANIDDAFLRRLDELVDFPVPDESLRLQLWERHLPPRLPRDDSVDLGFLADRFDLAGGNIRNIAMSAAFLAASGAGVVTMEGLIRSTGREYRKLGRLCVPSEFGEYHEFVN